MNIFSLFKKKTLITPMSINRSTCSKLVHMGSELETLIRTEIFQLLKPHYPTFNQNMLNEKHNGDKKVFESATIGLAIVNLVEYCEEKKLNGNLVTEAITHIKEIFKDPNTACVSNHAMKFIYDYKHFSEDDIAKKFSSKTEMIKTFTGAWVSRYYLGEQETIINTSAFQIGDIIQIHLGNIWGFNKESF